MAAALPTARTTPVAVGCCCAAHQPAGARRVLPTAVRPHGRTQSGDVRGAQAGAADLHPAGEEYTDQGQAYYEERYRQRVLHNLNRRALQLGMTLVPSAAAQAA